MFLLMFSVNQLVSNKCGLCAYLCTVKFKELFGHIKHKQNVH